MLGRTRLLKTISDYTELFLFLMLIEHVKLFVIYFNGRTAKLAEQE